MFDLSNITLAFSTESAAIEALALMQADMLAWHAADLYPANGELIAAIGAGMPHLSVSTLKVYSSRILKWARSGQTPADLKRCVNTDPAGAKKGRGGRPKGQGAGKKAPSTYAAAIAAAGQEAAEKPAVPNEDRSWKQFLESIKAQVPGRKDWEAADIVAFQDCASKMLALINRNAK
jgi:hypothetical protein